MVRFYAGLLALLAAMLLAPSANAQFGSIFDPPRPPGNIPNQPDFLPPQPLPPGPPPDQMTPPGDVQSQPLPPPPAANRMPPNSRIEPPPPNVAAPAPEEEAIPEPPTPKFANPTAVFSGLDKITGRITTFDVAINETVRFGALEVTPRVCYTRPPTELPQTDGFVEVDELTLQGELRRIFTGWMFAASPGLNAVEHPIYDVWLIDCKGGGSPAVTAETPANEPAPPRTAPRQQQRTPARSQAQPPQR
jgi:hypothetical protein